MATSVLLPQNIPLYQALLAKADSYPPQKHYQAAAYRKVAHTISQYQKDINDIELEADDLYDIDEILYHIQRIINGCGPKIAKFILTFIRTDPEPQPEPEQTVTNPENQSLYNALTEKAATYFKLYEAVPYIMGANAVATFEGSIYNEYINNDGWIYDIPGIGDKVIAFIQSYYTNVVPSNEPIYNALMAKAATYPVEDFWKARAYRKAALIASAYPVDIIKDASINNSRNWLKGLGYSTKDFVFQTFINNRKKKTASL